MATASMATGQEDGVDSSIKADLALKLVPVDFLLAQVDIWASLLSTGG